MSSPITAYDAVGHGYLVVALVFFVATGLWAWWCAPWALAWFFVWLVRDR